MAEAARQAASGAGVVWSGIKSVAVPASSAVIPALTAVAGVGSAVFDFIKFEIIRDFLQIIGLFFEGLRESLPSSFKTFWGNVAAFFRICFTCWLTDFYARNKLTISIVIFIIKAVIALIASIWFYGRVRNQSSNADKEGLDVVTWEMRSTKSKIITKYLVLVLTTLYLPVATDVVQILTCDLQFVAPGGDCYKHGHLGLTIAAVFIILIYMIPIPFQFVSLIHKNKPKVTLYDSLGQLRAGTTAYSDADYRADLEKDNSPFKSLYEDYERKWAYYKVIVMLMKLALILPVTLLVPTNGIGGRDPNAIVVDNTKKILIIQSAITLVVLGIYAIAAWTTAPFLEDSNDVLDGISRAACLGTGLLGLLTVVINNNKAETIFGIILNVINAIAMILMVILVLAAFPAVRRAARNVRQTLSFSMSRANRNQSLLFSAEFSLARERKLRIWHEFWDVIFSQDEQLRIPKDEKASQDDKDPNKYVPIQLGYSIGKMTPPYLVQFRGTVGERHAENKHIVAHESWASVEHALLLLGRMSPSDATQLTADMQTVLQSLVGLDVWCNLPFEGHPEGEEGTQRKRLTVMNTSSTKFGKLYVVPFPFCAVFISDDTDGQCIISYCPIVHGITRDANQGLKEFQEFVRSNFDPEVQRRRNIRLSLRALSGNRIYFYYQCTKNKTKSRQVSKTRTVRDANGHSRTEHYTETEHYTVSVLFTFHYGFFSVSHDGDVPWVNPATNEVLNVAKGFSVSLHFNDGEGYDHEGKHWTNESETIYAGTLGITSDYAMTDGLRKVLGYEGGPYAGNAVWQNHLPTIQSRYHAYRQHYVNEFKRKEQVLSYAFWYYVYNNDHITQQQLYQVLTQNETNPLIRALPEKYHDEFKMLYTKLQYFDAHPSAGFWFCFWHDVWIYNKDLKIIKDNAALFDVYQSDAIAYKPMIRSDLIELLQQHKLTGKAPGRFSLRQHWFNDALLDQLYNKMDQLAATVASAPPVEPSVQAQLVDNYSKASDFYQTPQLVRQHTAPEQVQEEKQLPPPESSIQPIAPTEPTTPAGNVVIEVTSSQGAPLLQQTIDSSSGTPTSTYTNIVQPITPTTTTPRGTSIMNPTNGPAPAPVNAWSGTMTTTPTMQPVMQPMTPGQPPQQQPYQGQPQQYYSPYPQGQPYPQQQPYPQAQPYPQQQPYPGQPQQYYVPHPGSPVHVPSQGYPQASPTQQYAPPPQSNSPPPGYFAPHPNAQYQPLQ